MKITFKKPFEFEGKKYDEIDLDLEKLTGKDLADASKEARIMGDVTPMQEFSPVYIAAVAGKAASINIDFILALPAKEFTAVKTHVQNFLFDN